MYEGMMMYKKSQLGRTLVEMLAVLSVLGAFTASVFTLIGNVTDKYKSSIILTQVREIRKAINSRYAALGIYTGLTTDILAKERLVSSNMIHNGKIYHAFKKEVSVAVGNTGGTGRSFFINFIGLPAQNCVDLALIDWATDNTAVLVGIRINDKTFTWQENKVDASGNFIKPADTALPLTLLKVSKACVSGENNKITWEFQ